MPLLETAFVFTVCLLLPLAGAPRWRQLRASSTGAARLAMYRKNIAMQWLGAGGAIWLAAPDHLLGSPASAAGMEWLTNVPLVRAIVLAAVLLPFAAQAWHIMRSRYDVRLRQQYMQAMRALQFMLPVGALERRWWIALAVSAGICEELVYRGFLMHYFTQQGLGLPLAWLLSSLAFGLGHAYQEGVKSVARTAFVGALLGLAAIASGGLLLPIILHAIADLLPLAWSGNAVEESR